LNVYITTLPASATLGSPAANVSFGRSGVAEIGITPVEAMLTGSGPLGGGALVAPVGAATPTIDLNAGAFVSR
jgi:hypothetical protein